MPFSELQAMLTRIRDKSASLNKTPDFSNREKLVKELITIDSEDDDSEEEGISSKEASSFMSIDAGSIHDNKIARWMHQHPDQTERI